MPTYATYELKRKELNKYQVKHVDYNTKEKESELEQSHDALEKLNKTLTKQINQEMQGRGFGPNIDYARLDPNTLDQTNPQDKKVFDALKEIKHEFYNDIKKSQQLNKNIEKLTNEIETRRQNVDKINTAMDVARAKETEKGKNIINEKLPKLRRLQENLEQYNQDIQQARADVKYYQSIVDKNKETLKKPQKAYYKAKKEVQNNKNLVKKIESDKKTLQNELSKIDKEKTKYQEKINNYDNQIGKLSQKIAKLQQETEDFPDDDKYLKNDEKIAAYRKEIDNLSLKRNKTVEAFSNNDFDSQRQKIQSQIVKLNNQLDYANTSLQKASTNLSHAQHEYDKVKTTLKESRDTRDKSKKELATLKSDRKKVESEARKTFNELNDCAKKYHLGYEYTSKAKSHNLQISPNHQNTHRANYSDTVIAQTNQNVDTIRTSRKIIDSNREILRTEAKQAINQNKEKRHTADLMLKNALKPPKPPQDENQQTLGETFTNVVENIKNSFK